MEFLDGYRHLFVNRSDTFAVQLPNGGYTRIAEPLTDNVLMSHLNGESTVGSYQLNQESMVKSVIFDLDPEHLKDPRQTAEKILASCFNRVKLSREAALLEASRHPDLSFHIWIFFDSLFPAQAAKWIGNKVLKKAGLNTKQIEVFPKQDRLTEGRPYGNFVKLPLGLHQEAKRWSRFLDLGSFEPLPSEVIKEVRGITFSDQDIKRIMGLGEKRDAQTSVKLPQNFKALPDEDSERVVQFLLRYWKPGHRNELETSFLGYALKKGINRDSVYHIIEEVTERTRDEEKQARLQLVDYHYQNRLDVSLKGRSGLRAIIKEMMKNG